MCNIYDDKYTIVTIISRMFLIYSHKEKIESLKKGLYIT